MEKQRQGGDSEEIGGSEFESKAKRARQGRRCR